MNIRIGLILLCVSAAFILTGCDTTSSFPTAQPISESQMNRDYDDTYKRLMNEKIQALDDRLKNNSDYQELQLKVAELELTNAALIQSNIMLEAENTTLSQDISNDVSQLQINDYLCENKEKLVQVFQEGYSTNKEAIFEAAGGNGHILDFQVRDAFLYKHAVVVFFE
jgi:hypothetical protein